MSASRTFLHGRVRLFHGDCLDVLDGLAENSVDACVTDPPYHLASIVKRFGNSNPEDVEKNVASRKIAGQGTSPHGLAATGFMGKQWDGGDIAFRPETWVKVLRVMKPGAHLVAFAAPKNQHRMICAIEDAGFEVRDCLIWAFGSGFPKSLNVSNAIDKAAGAEREVVGRKADPRYLSPANEASGSPMGNISPRANAAKNYARAGLLTAPATDTARQWSGWGTALKPAYEPICLARKPISEGSIAANVLRWGTGAINIDGCRVGVDGGCAGAGAVVFGDGLNGTFAKPVNGLGRWPANLLHDGSEEVLAAFPQTGPGQIGGINDPNGSFGYHGRANGKSTAGAKDAAGSAARFFYSAKADSDDRLGSKHPTVKPLDLIQYLCRLITPRGGTIIDPFAGTGTTAEAAYREGFDAILIEREAEYAADIEKRMSLVLSGPVERKTETVKKRGRTADAGPLFGEPIISNGREKYGGGTARRSSLSKRAPNHDHRSDRDEEMVTP